MASGIRSSSPLSSLQSSNATFRTASPEIRPRFQSTLVLPFELQQYVQTYLEESLFQQAFRFLISLVSASAGDRKKKVLIPSHEYLSAIATIAIHPRMTTRPESKDRPAESNLALQLLHTILKITGPINSGLVEAYQFRNLEPSDDESEDWRDNKLNLIYASTQNVFRCRDDFWAVLGWALNCACLSNMHQERWKYWSRWLEHVLDVLETDWELRSDNGTQESSLIWHYITTATGGGAAARRILRSIFADGKAKALSEFDQVFPKELKKPKEKQELKKQEEAVNVDEDIYGDWLQDDESTSEEDTKAFKVEGAERSSKRLRNRTPGAKNRRIQLLGRESPADGDESDTSTIGEEASSHSLGPPNSIAIRLRSLQLLAEVAANPNLASSFQDLQSLYTLYVEFIPPLPLSIFQRLTVVPKGLTGFKTNTLAKICEFLLYRLIEDEGRAFRPPHLAPITPERFATEYLPYAASDNSIDKQAKMSLVTESILRILLDTGMNQEQLVIVSTALNTGVRKRKSKAESIKNGVKYKKSLKGTEDEAFSVLSESSMRMTFMLMQALKN